MKMFFKKFTSNLLHGFLIFFIVSLVIFPQVAQAAISFVGSCENSAISGADVTLTLPSMLQDDIVIVAYTVGDNDSVDFDMAMITAGYTEVADVHAPTDTQDVELGVYWKVMGALPDAEGVVDGLGGTDAAVAAVCMVFRGVDTTTPMDVTPTTDALNNTMHPDPPSIDHNNPTGVWTVIVGASGHSLNTAAGTYTFPTGYTTNALEDGEIDTSDATVGMGYRSSGVSDPENPGVMTHSGTDSVNYVWAAATLALRPAAASAPTVTSNTASAGVSSASLAGEITATGGADATVRGFAWGTVSTLSGGDTSTTSDTVGQPFGVGTFGQNLINLLANNVYYFRAYATNANGTGYGSITSFTTSTDTTVRRMMRLFEGFVIKLFSGRIILFQR